MLVTAPDHKAITHFVDLERHLGSTHPVAVPPVRQDRIAMLSGETPFGGDDRTLVIASAEGREVACCAAFIDHRFQAYRGDEVGFVGCFAMGPDEPAVGVEALLEAEAWLTDRDVTRILAPVDGSFVGGAFLRTAGFAEEPMFPFRSNPPIYVEAFERAGYRAAYPEWSYYVDFRSESYQVMVRQSLERPRCVVRPLDKRRWDADMEISRQIYNDVFDRAEWYFAPMDSEEWRASWDPFRAVADPHLWVIAEVEGQPAGFCVGSPNFGPLMRRLDGDLNPLNRLRFFLGARRFHSGCLFLIAARPEFRRKNVGGALAASVMKRFEDRGLPGAEYCLVRDENRASRFLASMFGGEGRVLYHEFEKRFDRSTVS